MPFSSVGLLLCVAGASTVDFRREVRPILADHCFACHGPDEKSRKADLRLDRPGAKAIAGPTSELARRVSLAANDDEVMPPAKHSKPLSPRQRQVLRSWVAAGAKYDQHWSFVPPRKPPIPSPRTASWVKNPVDSFVLARIEREGIVPSSGAEKATLIRRVSLDLTGLPPTLAEVEAYLYDPSPRAYEKVVDRLLASPRYGERMALFWLDLARYADTHGYHIDSHRDMWRWRDWVIESFNNNLPFDRFTIDQLGGDLAPHATLDQRIASGFNRNHMINYEGGAIPEEYQTQYVVDRVNTTGAVWMGLTIGCAQCHDHKYDPLTQRDFYRLFAFFNNVPESGLDGQTGNAVPTMKAPTPSQRQQREQLRARVATTEAALKPWETKLIAAQAVWEKSALSTLAPAPTAGLVGHWELDGHVADTSGQYHHGQGVGKTTFEAGRLGQALRLHGDGHVEVPDVAHFDRTDAFSFGGWIRPENTGHMTVLSKMDDANGNRGFDLFVADGKPMVHLIHQWETNAIRLNAKAELKPKEWHHVFVIYNGAGKAAGVTLYVDGQRQEVAVTHDRLAGSIRADKPLRLGRRTPAAPFTGMLDDIRLYRRALSPSEVETLALTSPIRAILASKQRTPAQNDELREFYRQRHGPADYQKLRAEWVSLKADERRLEDAIPTTMVMAEMPQPRATFLLMRGNYAAKGEKVIAGAPASLPPLPAGAPPNRLGLAQWLVDPRHPLTARVAVNHFWQLFFGTGLVKTAEDFGVQGEFPSHPELLDYLASEFVAGKWDVKRTVRLLVTSAAYRQSAHMRPELLERDPENRLLARGPRFRLHAEMIRDQALAVAGLLDARVGGPSVYPYQPSNLWKDLAYGDRFSAQTYVESTGADLYRRAMYTFWKRTVPPPSLAAFDAPDREICTVRRARTNTPLQALVLLNDPTYVEAARALASRMLTEAGPEPAAKATWAFRTALARAPKPAEVDILVAAYRRQLQTYQKDPTAARRLLAVGASPVLAKHDPAQLAAWTTVASMLLNLDETVTRG